MLILFAKNFVLQSERGDLLRDPLRENSFTRRNIELFELLEMEPTTQCTVFLSYWKNGVLYCTCGHFLHKEIRANQQFINHTMDFLSVFEYVIKKGRLHGHRYRRTKMKKKCKKRDFRGIHDRFLRDQDFRFRMIQNHRDDDLCRRCVALADEDHSHRLTEQEYFHHESKWWHHSNKQGSDTMPLRHRSNFKQALSTLQRLQKEAGEEPQVLSCSHKHNGRHEVHLLHGGIDKVHGGLLIFPKVKKELRQVLNERGDLLVTVLGKILLDKTFLNSTLLQMDRLQLTSVYCNRRGLSRQHLKLPVFSMQVCNNWLQIRIDDQSIQSDYKYKSEHQNPEGKKSVLGISCAWWNRAPHQ